MLPPWDAGTEEGTEFSIDNNAIDPPVNISKITNNTVGAFKGLNPIPSLGEFRFVKTDEPMESTEPTKPAEPAEPTDSSGCKASFDFAVFTITALMLALLFRKKEEQSCGQSKHFEHMVAFFTPLSGIFLVKKGTVRRTRFSLRISFYNLVLERRDHLVLA